MSRNDKKEQPKTEAQDQAERQAVAETLVKHQDFITAVAIHGSSPERDNTVVREILDAYNKIDDTVEVVAACATCDKPFEKPFKIILAYCQTNKLW
jgi:CMP-N-acetylneuraminic acid synthetase